jgi:hypothetical protein
LHLQFRLQLDSFVKQRENRCGALWREIATVIKSHVTQTDARRLHLAELKRIDAESAAEIATNQERINCQEVNKHSRDSKSRTIEILSGGNQDLDCAVRTFDRETHRNHSKLEREDQNRHSQIIRNPQEAPQEGGKGREADRPVDPRVQPQHRRPPQLETQRRADRQADDDLSQIRNGARAGHQVAAAGPHPRRQRRRRRAARDEEKGEERGVRRDGQEGGDQRQVAPGVNVDQSL